MKQKRKYKKKKSNAIVKRRRVTGTDVSVSVNGQPVAEVTKLAATVDGRRKLVYISGGSNVEGIDAHKSKKIAINRATRGMPHLSGRIRRQL